MPINHVVINASPLITLYKSQLVGLLPQLFGKVYVPPAVWEEVTAYKDGKTPRDYSIGNRTPAIAARFWFMAF